jgi:hypothetical protein
VNPAICKSQKHICDSFLFSEILGAFEKRDLPPAAGIRHFSESALGIALFCQKPELKRAYNQAKQRSRLKPDHA